MQLHTELYWIFLNVFVLENADLSVPISTYEDLYFPNLE